MTDDASPDPYAVGVADGKRIERVTIVTFLRKAAVLRGPTARDVLREVLVEIEAGRAK